MQPWEWQRGTCKWGYLEWALTPTTRWHKEQEGTMWMCVCCKRTYQRGDLERGLTPTTSWRREHEGTRLMAVHVFVCSWQAHKGGEVCSCGRAGKEVTIWLDEIERLTAYWKNVWKLFVNVWKEGKIQKIVSYEFVLKEKCSSWMWNKDVRWKRKTFHLNNDWKDSKNLKIILLLFYLERKQ